MIRIETLDRHPHLVPAVAHLVWREFWADRASGLTEAYLAQAFGGQAEPGRVLKSLIALDAARDDALLGCVHLIDNDDDSLPELYPWLAAMVVVPERRGQGIGSQLVRALAREALVMGFADVWFGTDGPGFYERLGATQFACLGRDFRVMRMPTRAASR